MPSACFIIPEDAEVQAVSVNGQSADFYLESDPEAANGLVWSSETGDILFCLTAPLPQDILIQIAESISVFPPLTTQGGFENEKLFLLLAVTLGLLLSLFLASCARTVYIELPFEPEDLDMVEMFCFDSPTQAEKKVITDSADMKDLCDLLESALLKEKRPNLLPEDR